MKRLPLYPELEPAAVELEEPLDLDPGCQRCPLSKRAGLKSPCLGPRIRSGEGDMLMIVGEGPGQLEDSRGQPFIGRSGQALWDIVDDVWKGPVTVDNATRCMPGRGVMASDVDACRPYLSMVLRDVRPKRIITLGGWAAYSVLGRSLPVMSTRRGYGWLAWASDWKEQKDGATILRDGAPVPVFTVFHPATGLRNRFMMEWFRDDLRWALTANPSKPPWDGVVQVVTDVNDAKAAVADLRQGRVTFDCETSGRAFDDEFSLLCVALTRSGQNGAYVWDRQALFGESGRILADLMSDPKISKSGQNIKYDMTAIRAALGVEVKGVTFDTMLARRILDPDADASLAVLAEQVGMGGHKLEADAALTQAVKRLRKSAKADEPDPFIRAQLPPSVEARVRLGEEPKQWAFALLDTDLLHRYNARDSLSTDLLTNVLEDRLRDGTYPELERVWDDLIVPAVAAAEQVEAWGIAVDSQQVENYQLYLGSKISELSRRFDQYEKFNPSSPKEVAHMLFKVLKLDVPKRTDKGAPSTDKEALTLLKDQHHIVADLLEWRRLNKMMGTYAEALSSHIRSDGRVHPNLRIDGARTGRWSCQDPNLQNLPRVKDSIEGKMARDCFVAPHGRVLVEGDFSQLELRIAASLSGDPLMKEVFTSGIDYHLRTAQMVSRQVWGVDPEHVTDTMRTQCKQVNFAALYGASDEKIAFLLKISVEDAAKLKRAIFGRFVVLAGWMKQQLRHAQANGEAWTFWAGKPFRRRPLPGIVDKDGEKRSKAEHGSYNTPVQGTASDLCAFSFVECVRWIKEVDAPAKLVATIHDALLFEVDEAFAPILIREVSDIMTGWPSPGPQDVPFEVDFKVGKSWGSMVSVKEHA